MAERKVVLKRRRWADLLALSAAVYLLIAAFYPLELFSGSGAGEVQDEGGLIYAYAVAGVLGLVGLYVAHRLPVVGKILVALAGVVSLFGLTLLDGVVLGFLSLGVPGAILLLTAAFVGPMPTPDEEGQQRRMPLP